MSTDFLDAEQARAWLERWDRQQEFYIADREGRFSVLLDALTTLVERPDPLVVDLGVGPGSMAHRLVERIPQARVVGVDADPLLLGLGAAARPDDRIRLVRADLREPGWHGALGLDRAPDAYVSSTALHWLNRAPLRALITTCGQQVAPGGVFLDADHLYEESPDGPIDELNRRLTARRIEQVGSTANEDWEDWWRAVEEAPELRALLEERGRAGFDHAVDDLPTVDDYLDYLREAGFGLVGQIWQYGDDRLILGAHPGSASN